MRVDNKNTLYMFIISRDCKHIIRDINVTIVIMFDIF